MCFKRKNWLGNYNGTKEDWNRAYRHARLHHKHYNDLAYPFGGFWGKAYQIVCERYRPNRDDITAKELLSLLKLTDELLVSLKEKE